MLWVMGVVLVVLAVLGIWGMVWMHQTQKDWDGHFGYGE